MVDTTTTTAPPPALATESLSKSFGGLRAVRDVTLDFRVGELHAVIGPNGAGKSTFVNLLSGHFAPSAGRVWLAGREVTGLPAWRLARLGVARSFQRTNIFKPLSARENARLAAQAQTLPARSLWRAGDAALVAAADRALERVGLADQADAIAGTLSHGAQRQLEIAMALAGDPRVLLLDEPLAGMGQEEGRRMAELLRGLARDHAVLLIEHDMDFVFEVADRMSVLVEGAVLATGAPAAVRADAAVQKAYLGEAA